MIDNPFKVFVLKFADCLIRPHYGLRFLVELLLAAVCIEVLSCDHFRALGISAEGGVLLVALTFFWMAYSLLLGRKDKWESPWLASLVVGRCLLTVIIDVTLAYLCYVIMLRVAGNGPEFFADNLRLPEGIEYSESCACPDADIYRRGVSTNCSPYVMLTPDFPQICYGAVNPGESGRLRLQVYEATTGTCLLNSEASDRLWESIDDRLHVCGWSENNDECFTFLRTCPIPNGHRNRPYVVSVELWFKPDSDRPMRMLLSRNILVHGRY